MHTEMAEKLVARNPHEYTTAEWPTDHEYPKGNDIALHPIYV